MPSHKSYQFINLFRVIASLWVVFTHCMIWGGWYGINIPNPKMAVDLFMIISGYLMINQVTLRKDKEPMHSIKNQIRFFARRFFRIAPAYYFSLFLAVLFSSYFLGGYEALQNLNPKPWEKTFIYLPDRIHFDEINILLHLSFLFGLDPQYSFSTFLPDWSLSLEMQFYFVFPLIFLLISNFELKKVLFTLFIIAFLSTLLINHFLFFYEPSFLLFKLQYFLVGILLYYLLHKALILKDKVLLLLFAYLFIEIESRFNTPILFYLFLLMLCMAWFEIHFQLPTFFESKIIKFMSDTSFSLYLFHGFFISMGGFILSSSSFLRESSLFIHTVFLFLFVIPSAYLFGYVVFKNIETRGIKYGKSFINKYISLK